MKIKNRFTGKTLLEIETLKKANLSMAYLSGADLSWVNLYKADLSNADLSNADLSWSYLSKTKLSKANLSNVYLSNVYLSEADFFGADLSGADLSGVNLSSINFSWVNFSGANLYRADLSGADLSGADLSGVEFSWTKLSGAELKHTVLDPMAVPNGNTEEFHTINNWCIGYRTKRSQHVTNTLYNIGDIHTAPVFSVCTTECHPGIFVLPTAEEARTWDQSGEGVVEVIFRPWDCHKAGKKWRVRELIVWRDC